MKPINDCTLADVLMLIVRLNKNTNTQIAVKALDMLDIVNGGFDEAKALAFVYNYINMTTPMALSMKNEPDIDPEVLGFAIKYFGIKDAADGRCIDASIVHANIHELVEVMRTTLDDDLEEAEDTAISLILGNCGGDSLRDDVIEAITTMCCLVKEDRLGADEAHYFIMAMDLPFPVVNPVPFEKLNQYER